MNRNRTIESQAAGPLLLIPTWDQLDAAGRLVFAHGWERAAFVAAFVSLPGSGSHNKQKGSSSFLSPGEFAARGFVGLTSAHAVRRYAKAWRDAGMARPRPGEQVLLPTVPFPKWGEHADPVPTNVDTPVTSPRPPQRSALDALLASNDPGEWAAVMTRADKSPEFLEQVAQRMRERMRPRTRTRTRSGNVVSIRGTA